jgi:hypothetical protein
VTTVQEAAREGSSPETPAAEANPESAQRTRSVTLPSLPAKEAVTQRVRKAGEVASRAAALLDRPGSLVHSQPPTFRQARDRHHECARHYRHSAVRWPRLLWGYLHLLAIKPALNLAEWLTESPARFLVAVTVAAVIWFFT